MATRKPVTYHCRATRWSLDDLVVALFQRRTWTMRRSSLWRMLDEADLQPPRSVYWLNSHASDFEAKAHHLCAFYLQARRVFEPGRLVMCSEEKTGRQMLARTYPPHPIAPGKPAKREHEDLRHGTRALSASFVVPTGQVVWHLGETRTRADCAAHVAPLEVYNTHQAHPSRWPYTGQPLVRATPFRQTRRQQRPGRAWFSSRSQRFERAFYPPRSYKRAAA